MKKIALLCFLLSPLTILSQEKQLLTLEEAIRLGLENSKLLRISSAKVLSADAKSSEINAARLPSVRLQAGYTRLSDVDPFTVQLPILPSPVTISPIVTNNYTSRLTVQQPLFTGLRLEKSAAAAEFSAQAASQDYTKDRADYAYSVKDAYWNLFKALEVKKVIGENLEQVTSHLRDVQNMMAQGLVTKNEVLKVQVQLSNIQLAQIDATNSVRLAMMRLNNLIGLPLDTELQIASSLPSPPKEVPSVTQLVQDAFVNRPDLKAAEMRVRASDATVAAAKGAWYPQISLSGNYYYSRPNPRILPTRDEFKDTWDVGLTLSFELWNWGTTKHQAVQAEAALAQAADTRDHLRDLITLEVNESYLAVLQTAEKVGVAEKGVEQAEENYRITRNKFSSGTATNTDLLDAEVSLLQSKLNHTVSLVELELAHARLLKARGREN